MNKSLTLPDMPTIGIEEEHFIVSTRSENLENLPADAVDALSDRLGSNMSLEYKSCQIEMKTKPATCGDHLLKHLKRNRNVADAALNKFDLKLFSKSAHPVANWRDFQARPDKRYANIESRLGDNVRRLLTAGLHVHIGTFPDHDVPVQRMLQFWFLVPTLVAANASSSSWCGRDTGFVSNRRNILLGLSSQCPPPVYCRKEFEEYLALQVKLGAAEKENDLWLDIRPGRKGLDTVEFRAADISPDVHANVSIAIFLQGLEFIARTRPWSLPDMPDAYERNLIEQSARFSAKSGFDAQVFDPFRKSARNLREFSLELLELAAPGINACGNGSWVPRINRLFTRQATRQEDTRELIHSGV